MLFLCLRFPYLPLEVFAAGYREDKPQWVEESRKVLLANGAAERRGIKVGMNMATASALLEGSDDISRDNAAVAGIYSRDPTREQASLERLAAAAYHFTPAVYCYRPDALILEIHGSLKLFHGLANLLRRLQHSFAQLPHDYCCGVAHTVKAAWLLSFVDQRCVDGLVTEPAAEPETESDSHPLSPSGLMDSEYFIRQLSLLPVALLVDFPAVVKGLANSGIALIGQLLAIPLAELGRRFGNDFVHYLQQLQGDRVERIAHLVVPPQFQRSFDYSYAVEDWQLLLLPMENLLRELVDYLTRQQLQCSEIHWRLLSPTRQSYEFSISCQRVYSQWQPLLELTAIKLANVDAAMTVEVVTLRCDRFSPLELRIPSLLAGIDPGDEDCGNDGFEQLVARLQVRFGERWVYQLSQQDTHVPERAWAARPVRLSAAKKESRQSIPVLLAERPCWLLAEPRRLFLRDGQLYWRGYLTVLQGPERIECDWWQREVSRDYFVALQDDQQRCWIFRDHRQQQWYLHGLFA